MIAAQLQARFASLLGKLKLQEIQVLIDYLEPVAVAPAEVLCRCGETADALYLVREGHLKLSLAVAGEEIELGRIGPGRFVGVAAVIDPGPALLTVQAIEPGVVLRLRHQDLNALRSTHPRLGSELLRAFSLNLVNWLRAYEDYVIGHNEDIVEFFRLGRLQNPA